MDDETKRQFKPKGRKRPRAWHRGGMQDALWTAAVARLDTARLAEGLQDPRETSDPVLAPVSGEADHGRERRSSADPADQHDQGRRP